MLASETRRLAREALQGKWGKAALVGLIYALLTGLISGILNLIPIAGPIAQAIIQIPLTFGFVATLIKLKRGENVTYTEFFSNGFSNFASSWKVTLWTAVKLIVPAILIFVSVFIIVLGVGVDNYTALSSSTSSGYLAGSTVAASTTPNIQNPVLCVIGFILLVVSSIWSTVKSYLYKPTFFILFDNPNMSAKDIVEESEKIMTGNRWKYFCLELSFIGWYILVGFTLGIGMLWLLPYMLIAQVVFYEFLAGKEKKVEAEVTTEEK